MTRIRIILALAGALGLAFVVPTVVGADTEYHFADRYQPAFAPVRVVDTRTTQRLDADVPLTVVLPAIPHPNGDAPAVAAAVNITVVDPAGDGYLTAWTTGYPQPAVSNVNFNAGDIATNFAIVPIVDGTFDLVSSVDADVIVDLFGTFDQPYAAWVP